MAKSKGGRPKKQIAWAQVNKLCEIQATAEEIALVIGVSSDTLARACKAEKKMGIAEYIAEKRRKGFVSLRRKQFQKAMSGNVVMLIWLGKQWLGQTDRREISGEIANVSLEELARRRADRAQRTTPTLAAALALIEGEADG